MTKLRPVVFWINGVPRAMGAFTVVNGPRLTRAISRRCAIARRRHRHILFINDVITVCVSASLRAHGRQRSCCSVPPRRCIVTVFVQFPVRHNEEMPIIHGRPHKNRLDTRWGLVNSENTTVQAYFRHPIVPYNSPPRGDAAIVACQAHLHGALDSTQIRGSKTDSNC
jgi:hypothetical protein